MTQYLYTVEDDWDRVVATFLEEEKLIKWLEIRKGEVASTRYQYEIYRCKLVSSDDGSLDLHDEHLGREDEFLRNHWRGESFNVAKQTPSSKGGQR